MAETTLIVTEIERGAIHDGPGLRTVVFLQGCPLRCVWCCNPETQSMRPVLLHDGKRCVGCGACAAVCPHSAVRVEDGRARIDRSRCAGCGRCADACPTGADALSGKVMTVPELLRIVLRDRAYYDAAGGGLTLSGGEPLMQQGALELLRRARAEGLDTAVETTACVETQRLLEAARWTDRFLVDYKHSDAAALKKWTGAELGTVQAHIRALAEAGVPVTLRTPVIPGVNDGPEALRKCFEFALSLGLSEYVLLPYHALGRGKYDKLGLDYALDDIRTAAAAELEPLADLGRSMGLAVKTGG